MELLIMQYFPASCYFLPLISKYYSQHPLLKHPMYILPLGSDTKLYTYTKQQVKLWLCIF